MKGTGLRTERDPRAATHPAARLLSAVGDIAPIHAEPKRYRYHRIAPILDQNGFPACTGYMVRQAVSSGPFMQKGGPDAFTLYRRICERDARVFGWPLSYDNGATVDSAAAVMKGEGWADSYWWLNRDASGADQALEWVCRGGGVLLGTPWLPSMDTPRPKDGFAAIQAGEPILGWHAWYLGGVNRIAGTWKAPNSWGVDFGDRGSFRGAIDGLRTLFSMGAYGACVVERRA